MPIDNENSMTGLYRACKVVSGDLRKAIARYFPKQQAEATTVAFCQSGFDAKKKKANLYGLFQLTSDQLMSARVADPYSVDCNTRAATKLFKQMGWWYQKCMPEPWNSVHVEFKLDREPIRWVIPAPSGEVKEALRRYFRSASDYETAVEIASCSAALNPDSPIPSPLNARNNWSAPEGGTDYKGLFSLGPEQLKTYHVNNPYDPMENARAAAEMVKYYGWRYWAQPAMASALWGNQGCVIGR